MRYAFDAFVVDPAEQRLLREGSPVPLEPKVFDTLVVLLRDAGRLVGKDELMRSVWPDTIVEEGNLTRNVSVLRKVLGAASIETVPRRGYRFVPPVRVLGAALENATVALPSPEPLEAPPRQRFSRWLAGPGAGVARRWVFLVVASALVVVFLRFGRGNEGPIGSVAVLPFVNATGEPAADYLSDGISETLIDGLARLPELRVVSRNAAFRHRGPTLDVGAARRSLRVDAVLTGRLATGDGGLVVRAELTDLRSGRHLWGQQYRAAAGGLLELQERLLGDLAGWLRPEAPATDRMRFARAGTGSREAYDLYLKGRFHLNALDEVGLVRALEYLERATRADAEYGPAWATLASAYAQTGMVGTTFLLQRRDAMTKARAAADRAIELDPTLAAAHDALGQIALAQWDWQTAEAAFRRAITANPEDPSPRHWCSHYFLVMGRFPESLEQSLKALALDPLDTGMQLHLGLHHLIAGDLDLAMAQLQRTLATRSHPEAHNILGLVYEQKGLYARAEEELRWGGGIDMRGALGHVLARAGRRDEARALLAELLSEAPRREISGYNVAKIHAALGEREEAFRWLERAYAARDPNLSMLAVDPQLAELRGDPRQRDLLRRLHMPPLGDGAGGESVAFPP